MSIFGKYHYVHNKVFMSKNAVQVSMQDNTENHACQLYAVL